MYLRELDNSETAGGEVQEDLQTSRLSCLLRKKQRIEKKNEDMSGGHRG